MALLTTFDLEQPFLSNSEERRVAESANPHCPLLIVNSRVQEAPRRLWGDAGVRPRRTNRQRTQKGLLCNSTPSTGHKAELTAALSAADAVRKKIPEK